MTSTAWKETVTSSLLIVFLKAVLKYFIFRKKKYSTRKASFSLQKTEQQKQQKNPLKPQLTPDNSPNLQEESTEIKTDDRK